MSDYNELVEYWSEHPPTHLLVGALLGSFSDQPPSQTNQPKPSGKFWADDPNIPNWKNESFEDLMRRWNGAQAAFRGGPQL